LQPIAKLGNHFQRNLLCYAVRFPTELSRKHLPVHLHVCSGGYVLRWTVDSLCRQQLRCTSHLSVYRPS
jgi:hypothetical protein